MNFINNYDELLTEIKKYISNANEIEFINKAYHYAEKIHSNQFRHSGEPYVIHLINVCYILARWRTSADILVVGLLHDIIEDQNITFKELEDNFGTSIANLVDNLTKVNKFLLDKSLEKNINSMNVQKIIIAMSKDVQVIIVKFADRIHNLNTLEYMPPNKQQSIAKQTEMLYLPIARLFGLQNVVDALGDRIIEYLHPDIYKKITKSLSLNADKNNIFLNNLVKEISELINIEIKDVRFEARIKNIFSIYSKLNNKQKDLEEIYDIYGIRIITKNVPDCYTILGIIQSKYDYIKNRFKNYIISPKKNLYQAIHTTITVKKINIEVQILTEDMRRLSKVGLASHYIYKENIIEDNSFGKSNNKKFISIHSKLSDINDDDYLKRINNVFIQNIYVITPSGDCIIMDQGSNALDFAFRIHTEVGMTAYSCTINGIPKPLKTPLHNGDIVNIQRGKEARPTKELLKRVSNPYSVASIKKYNRLLLLEEKNAKIALGKELLERYISQNDKYKIYFNSDDFLKWINYRTIEDLYYAIGKDSTLINKIFRKYEKGQESIKNDNISKGHSNYSLFIISGATNIAATLSQCCLPIPGDPIVAIVSKTKGLKIHHADCLNTEDIDNKNIIFDAQWNSKVVSNMHFSTKIIITFFPGKLLDINQSKEIKNVISKIEKFNIKITELHTKSNKNNLIEFNVKLSIKHLTELNRLMVNLKKIKNIDSVQREYNYNSIDNVKYNYK